MPARAPGFPSESTLRERRGAPPSGREIVGLLKRALALLRGAVGPGRAGLHAEIEELIRYIQAAKEEIKALCPERIAGAHIPMATDELDAIVAHTEEATDSILEATERIEEVAAGVSGEEGRKIAGAATQIYEACNFQDITGQRISKVVATLKHIEETLQALAAALDGGAGEAAAGRKGRRGAKAGPAERAEGRAGEASLLNGPQLPLAAAKQDEIDALMENRG